MQLWQHKPGLQTWWRRCSWAVRWAPHTAAGPRQTSGVLLLAHSGPYGNNCSGVARREEDKGEREQSNDVSKLLSLYTNHIKMTSMHNHQRHAATEAITKDKWANSSPHITAGLYIITLLALTLASDPPCYMITHLPSPHRFHLQACPFLRNLWYMSDHKIFTQS